MEVNVRFGLHWVPEGPARFRKAKDVGDSCVPLLLLGPGQHIVTTGPAPAPQCQQKLGLLGFRELRKDGGNRGGRGGAAQAWASKVLASGQRRPAVG